MTRICAVPGCVRPVGGGSRAARAWSIHCSAHRSHERRHGHAQQRPVTKQELRPYLQAIDRRLRAQPEARAWDAASERFRAIADSCATDLAAYSRGQPMSETHRRCCEEIDKLARAAEPREVWRLVAGMVMLARRDARRFRSDEAFFVQVARVVRRLRDVNAYETWDHQAQRVRRGYRDPARRVLQEMGRVLTLSLGSVGITFLRLEDREEERQAKAKADLSAALTELENAPGAAA